MKILPRGGPPAKDGGDDELEEEDVDMDDENEGDRGSWFHWFGDEESHSAVSHCFSKNGRGRVCADAFWGW